MAHSRRAAVHGSRSLSIDTAACSSSHRTRVWARFGDPSAPVALPIAQRPRYQSHIPLHLVGCAKW